MSRKPKIQARSETPSKNVPRADRNAGPLNEKKISREPSGFAKMIGFIGSLSLFNLSAMRWLLYRPPRWRNLRPLFYSIGVASTTVVGMTGFFIGMVLAVQSYHSFREMGLESRMGAVINVTLVKELGPVLAATMLAGRIGSAMAAELGGLDAVVFTAGIGEHSAHVRARVCQGLAWLGALLDQDLNLGNATGRISQPGSRLDLLVIPTDEEAQIASELAGLI